MRLPKLAVPVVSFSLLASPAGRLAMVVISAAPTTSCEPCTVGPVMPDTLPDGQMGMAFFFQLHAPHQGGCGWGVQHTTFSLTHGALPASMKMSEDGALDGTPSASGVYTFTVAATLDTGSDSYPVDSEPRTYTLTIAP
jgi:hypothetical protein